jgi:hypothetical protein
MGVLADLTDYRFGLWTVIGPDQRKRLRTIWFCRCQCGTERWVGAGDLTSGQSTNCGCVRRKKVAARNYKHGQGHTRLHARWMGMIARCESPKHKAYPRYGGRGIRVCQRWRDSFAAFLADMGPPPGPNYQLDRIDNDGDYKPGNVRWALNKPNSRNRPSAIFITFQGVTLPLNEWAERMGLPPKTVYSRIKNLGWTVEKALTTPVTVNWAASRSKPQHSS